MDYLNRDMIEKAECIGQSVSNLPLVNPTLTQSLELRKDRLERELASVTEALYALKANPDIEKVLNLIQKIR